MIHCRFFKIDYKCHILYSFLSQKNPNKTKNKKPMGNIAHLNNRHHKISFIESYKKKYEQCSITDPVLKNQFFPGHSVYNWSLIVTV